MEKFWSYLHYTIYRFEVNASKVITYPISLILDSIYKIPFISRNLEKKGSSVDELKRASDDVMYNPEYGQGITIAGIHMGGLLVLIEFSLFNFLQAILGKSLIQYIWGDSINKWLFLLGLLVVPGIINHYLLWKGDKYLKYFKEFEKEPKGIKLKWAWISLGVICGVLLVFVLSIFLYSYYCF